MNTIQTQFYPLFVPGQVLSPNRLNEIIQYLDGESRVTRTDLVGSGIAFGLELEWNGTTLKIEPGFGISSDGFLLKLWEGVTAPEFIYNRYTDFVVPDGADAVPWYSNVLPSMPGVKILLESTNPQTGTQLSTLPTPGNWVVALWLRTQEYDEQNCVGNCDEIGKENRFELVPLLVDTTIFPTMVPPPSTPGLLEHASIIRLLPRRTNVNDGLTTGISFVPAGITESEDLYNWYGDVVNEMIPSLITALNSASTLFEGILALNATDQANLTATIAALNTALTLTPGADFQYAYDLMRDLAIAYREFVDAAYYVSRVTNVPYDAHTRYLFLGSLVAPADPEASDRRHYFAHAPTEDEREYNRVKVQMLFRRMLAMVLAFDPGRLASTGELRITPSAYTPELLGKRAIPGYYDLTFAPSLLKLWNPEATLQGKRNQARSFWAGTPDYTTANVYARFALEHNIDEAPFYRIEGHLGTDANTTLANLRTQIDENNLSIEVIALAVPETADPEWVPSSSWREKFCGQLGLQAQYELLRREFMAWIRVQLTTFSNLATDCLEVLTEERLSVIPVNLPSTQLLNGNEIFQSTTSQNQLRINTSQGRGSASSLPLLTSLEGMLDTQILPTLLPEFVYPDFLSAYNAMLRDAITVRTQATALYDEIAHERRFRYSTPAGMWAGPQLCCLIRQLDLILHNRLFEELRQLASWLTWGVSRALEASSVASYAAENPGMEHLAGVPKGGTFILVYEDDGNGEGAMGIVSGTVIGDFALPGKCCDDCAPVDFGESPSEPDVEILPIHGFAEVFEGGLVTIDLGFYPRDPQEYTVTLTQGQLGVASVALIAGEINVGGGRAATGNSNRLRITYGALPDGLQSVYAQLDEVIVNITHSTTQTSETISVFVVVRKSCLPFLGAKDLYAAILNEGGNMVKIEVLDPELWGLEGGERLRLRIGQAPEIGRALARTTSTGNRFWIEYSISQQDGDFQGLVPFEYELYSVSLINGQLVETGKSAIGTVSVHVLKCCKDEKEGLVANQNYEWIVTQGSSTLYTLNLTELTEASTEDVEFMSVIPDEQDIFGNLEIIDIGLGTKNGLQFAPGSGFFDRLAGQPLGAPPIFLHPNGANWIYILRSKVSGELVTGIVNTRPAALPFGISTLDGIKQVDIAFERRDTIATHLTTAMNLAQQLSNATQLVADIDRARVTAGQVLLDFDNIFDSATNLSGAETVAVNRQADVIQGLPRAQAFRDSITSTNSQAFVLGSNLNTAIDTANGPVYGGQPGIMDVLAELNAAKLLHDQLILARSNAFTIADGIVNYYANL